MKKNASLHIAIKIPVFVRVKEVLGSLFDLWFLLPLVGLMVVSERGGNATMMGRDLIFLGGAWFLSALLYRTPLPLQPLKVWAFLFLILRPTPLVASLSGLLLGALLLLSSVSGLTNALDKNLSERSIARIRRGVGIYVRVVAILAMGMVLLRALHALLPSGILSWLPGAGEPSLSVGLSVLLLVLPQFPVTLVNGVLATVRERTRSGPKSGCPELLTGESLSGWVGLSSLFAGLFGTLPFCHGSGNLWVYRRFGVQSILPSLVSSVLLISLGSGLVWHPVPMPSVFFLGAFLGGFFLAERFLKGEERSVLSEFRERPRESLLDWIVLSGGLLSGVLILGGIPLLLVLLLGAQTAVAVRGSSGDSGERPSFSSTHFAGASPSLEASKKTALLSEPKERISSSLEILLKEDPSPSGDSTIHDPQDGRLFPEHFFRRAREFPEAFFALILLVLFSGSLRFGSLPRPCFSPPFNQSFESSSQPPARAP